MCRAGWDPAGQARRPGERPRERVMGTGGPDTEWGEIQGRSGCGRADEKGGTRSRSQREKERRGQVPGRECALDRGVCRVTGEPTARHGRARPEKVHVPKPQLTSPPRGHRRARAAGRGAGRAEGLPRGCLGLFSTVCSLLKARAARGMRPPRVPWPLDVAGCVHRRAFMHTHAHRPGLLRAVLPGRPGIKQEGQKGDHL